MAIKINQLLRQFKNTLSFIEVKRCRRLRTPPNNILFPIIWITNRCNLRCKMCDKWEMAQERLSDELSTQEWCSFIDSASHMHVAIIVITGGEPLLREDIFDIIKYIRKKGIASHLCTNGTLLNEFTVNKLKDAKLNSVSVSLDNYDAQVHNEIRGVSCFDTVVKGIRLLRRSSPGLKIGINYVITKLNFRNMERMIPFVEDLGVNQIKFDVIHTNLMHRQKSIFSFGDLLFDTADLPQLQLEINKLINAISQTKLLTNSRTFLKGIPDVLKQHKHKFCCYAGYISCAIDALGRVSPCDNSDGNESIKDKPFEKIWGSEDFQRLRESVDNCQSRCWDTTHTELNIRCSWRRLIRELDHVLKERRFYLS